MQNYSEGEEKKKEQQIDLIKQKKSHYNVCTQINGTDFCFDINKAFIYLYASISNVEYIFLKTDTKANKHSVFITKR